MACSKTLTIEPAVEEDMPLDQAIYSASQDKIYGVRGKWIFKFNAATGDKEAELRFSDDAFAEASIVEIGSFLYVGVWRAVIELVTEAFPPNRDVFKISHDFSTFVNLGLNALAVYLPNDWNFTDAQFAAGFTNLMTDGTFLYGTKMVSGNQFFKVNPTNLATAVILNFGHGPASIVGVEYDSTNGAIWIADARNRQVHAIDKAYNTNGDENSSAPATMTSVYGLTYCVSNTRVYAVNGTDTIIKVNAAIGLPLAGFPPSFTWTTLPILDAAAKPVKIKYNPNDGLIYIPTWSNDTVEILNPATDTISAIKTGFVDPFDVVFTPTKKWAVQNSGIPLQEIT